ncbi:ABC transporter permease [Myxococcus sp. K15C18031901]|uniref:ABC transporter permease n=1 Tax=Myxococcus dinghuensis TaxID=2906761 RepID=UPI0020A81DE1|nr:ABC transporter permease [Myxococcus dinghuensis]MCP3101279.1 ABC transporter permease [Myxococcus dinghuensis]
MARIADGVGDIGSDFKFALRMLRKDPLFTVVAVLCLAFGIGANAAIFSVVDAVLLRPLPYEEPERLVRLFETTPAQDPKWLGSVSWPNYQDWAAQLPSLDGVAAYELQGRNLMTPEGAERVAVVATTANLFQVLGTPPKLGPGFSPGDDHPGAQPVVVVGEGLWQRRFGADPGLVGRTLTLDGQPHTVVGILPATVGFPAGARMDVFVPFVPSADRVDNRGAHFLSVLGRLRPGASARTLGAELGEVARRIEEAHPAQQAGRSATAVSLAETVVGDARPTLLLLQGAVLLVLLIACANVANLLLARTSTRQQEIAIRFALGASRGRVVRQLLVESLLLSLLGAVIGVLLGSWGVNTLGSWVRTSFPLTGELPLNARVVGFLLVVSVGSALAFGLAPALQATRTPLRASLAEPGAKLSPSRSHHFFRAALVVVEIALSLVLLVGAGLLLRGFLTLLGTEPGLDARNVITAHLPITAAQYPREEVVERLFKPILEKARALPGVQSAALISLLPIQTAWTSGDYAVEGEPAADPGKALFAEFRTTSPDLFKTLGIPLLAGRDFTEDDGRREERVVIVNQALARRHFQGGDAVGRRLLLAGQPAEIIGVVGDVRQAGLDQQPLPEVHLPYNHAQSTLWYFQAVTLVLKTSASPTHVAPLLRAAVRSVDSEQPLYNVFTMEEIIQQSVAGRRLNLSLLGAFALIALVLATAGLYGVISFLVSQRTQEIGIRMALGAPPGQVVRLVMDQGLKLVGLGICLGVVAAFVLSRYMESLLYGVSGRDPLTFVGFSVLLGSVALIATWLPARRASRVDPLSAIQNR